MTGKAVLAPGYIDNVNGDLTFVGVLRKHFDIESEIKPISDPWNAESTRVQYIRDYERRLIPEIDNYKPLSLFSVEDLRASMEKIQRKYQYDEKTMQHYLYLFYRVYKAGLDRGLYKDSLFVDILTLNEAIKESNDQKLSGEKRKKIKKSLPRQDEKKILDWFATLDPKTATGEDIGFVLMFNIPTRNQEVCGVNYEDLRLMSESNFPTVYIYKTTTKNSNRLKAGGKTSNASRIIPLLDFLYDFIEVRRKFIEESVQSGEIVLPEEYESVGKMPVVCKGKNYFERCKTIDISNVARQKFKELNVGMEALEETAKTLLIKAEIEEEEPTAYLLRRNNCKHLKIIGLSEAEMQYLMGHEIEDPAKNRNYFANEECLGEIYKKLKKHPFNFYLSQDSSIKEIGDAPYWNKICCTEKFRLMPEGEKSKFNIEIIPNELSDEIEILIDDNLECKIETADFCINSSMKPPIDISAIVNKYYCNKKGGNGNE